MLHQLKVKCKNNGCTEICLYSELRDHEENKCKQLFSVYQDCGKSFRNDDFQKHEDECPEKTLSCEKCSFLSKRKEAFEQHHCASIKFMMNSINRLEKRMDELFNKVIAEEKKMESDQLKQTIIGLQKELELLKPKEFMWENGEKRYTPKNISNSNSYFVIKCSTPLFGPFKCKVKIWSINEGITKDYWSYTFGVIKRNSIKNSDYFHDSLLFHSNGYIAPQFSGSGGGNRLFNELWKIGDVLIVKRDAEGNVFFGINDKNNLKIAFSNIQEDFLLMLGFSQIVTQGSFEILALDKN